jgi:exodeoxyribonuclease VII large subunit
MLREMRASARRCGVDGRRDMRTRALVLSRKAAAAGGGDAAARRTKLDALTLALTAHDPERVIERGYAVVDDGAGTLVTSAAEARATGRVRLFFSDDAVPAKIDEEDA